MTTPNSASRSHSASLTSVLVDTADWVVEKPLSMNDYELREYLSHLPPFTVTVNAGEGVECKLTISVQIDETRVLNNYVSEIKKLLFFKYVLESDRSDALNVRIGVVLSGKVLYCDWEYDKQCNIKPVVFTSERVFLGVFAQRYFKSNFINFKFRFEQMRTEVNQTIAKTKQQLSSLGARILANSKLSDLTVIAANEDKFPAHKFILTSQSPVFDRMFSSKMKEETEMVLELKDVDAGSVRSFLDYLYGEDIDSDSISNADIMTDLLLLSDKYEIVELKTAAEEWLCDLADVQNVCRTVVTADLVGAEKLKDHCIDFIVGNRSGITEFDAWKDLKTNYAELYLEIVEAIANL